MSFVVRLAHAIGGSSRPGLPVKCEGVSRVRGAGVVTSLKLTQTPLMSKDHCTQPSSAAQSWQHSLQSSGCGGPLATVSLGASSHLPSSPICIHVQLDPVQRAPVQRLHWSFDFIQPTAAQLAWPPWSRRSAAAVPIIQLSESEGWKKTKPPLPPFW